ncbi:MAG: hypothetical protein R3F19_27250 [Verrucomicrobiales bacterium]
MHNRTISTSLAALAIIGLASCSSLKQAINPKPNLQPARAKALVPQEFLLTDYTPLNEWLDTPVHVDILNVPLSKVFQQPSLAGLNHNLTGFSQGEDEPNVTLNEVAITRRQLLWSLSQDYKLAMVPKFDAQGGSSYIDIRVQ